jgi:hypothetical protein
MTLDFGDCEIDLERRELWRAKFAVHVEPLVFDLLVDLVQNRDRVVSKDDLIAVELCPNRRRPAVSTRREMRSATAVGSGS